MNNIHHVIYINLDRRKDRCQEINQEFDKMKISKEKITRFSAIENNSRPEVGCFQSHLQVLKIARDKKYKNVLILEDDFTFLVEKEELEKILNNFFNSESDFDAVMLSYNLIESKEYNNLVGRVLFAQTASGYLVNQKFYDILICNLEKNLKSLIDTGKHWLYACDVCWKPLQQKYKFFFFKKRIGKQRKSYSDLGKEVVDYKC